MIILPQTLITENSFNRWRCHKIEVEDGIDSYHYYVIPLVDVDDEDALENIEYTPALFSSESDEFFDEKGNTVYTLRLFDDDLPELTTEEEVEIIYEILTKKKLFI
jgi:hypothetical protein